MEKNSNSDLHEPDESPFIADMNARVCAYGKDNHPWFAFDFFTGREPPIGYEVHALLPSGEICVVRKGGVLWSDTDSMERHFTTDEMLAFRPYPEPPTRGNFEQLQSLNGCDHVLVSIKNEHISDGSMCVRCGSLKTDADYEEQKAAEIVGEISFRPKIGDYVHFNGDSQTSIGADSEGVVIHVDGTEVVLYHHENVIETIQIEHAIVLRRVVVHLTELDHQLRERMRDAQGKTIPFKLADRVVRWILT